MIDTITKWQFNKIFLRKYFFHFTTNGIIQTIIIIDIKEATIF